MNPTRASVDVLIAERITADPRFRDTLLADPRTALATLTGIEIPDAVTVTVHEESPADIHLVLPSANGLSDADLELVGGGWDPGPVVVHGCAHR